MDRAEPSKGGGVYGGDANLSKSLEIPDLWQSSKNCASMSEGVKNVVYGERISLGVGQ